MKRRASRLRASAGPKLKVVVTDEFGRRLPSAGLAAWLTRTAPSRARGTVTVALVSDARVRSLNREYRGKDYATDVLSFPGSHETRRRVRLRSPNKARRAMARQVKRRGNRSSPKPLAPSPHLGDIVIARGVARRQARVAGHGEPVELRVLALHGLLHLLGYDHERDHGEMARLEQRLRRKGGLQQGLMER